MKPSREPAQEPEAPAANDAIAKNARPIPLATYRLQFNREFTFDHAASLAPYLADLGVSHVYCSPYLKARPGSTHGYDIISHSEFNPDLGGRAGFERMVAAFRKYDLRQVLDFVPNHMGVGGADNPWWLDVLEWGPDSAFAAWFDIEWEPDQRYLSGKLLAPFLGEQYGAALVSGALRLKFDPKVGSLAVWAYDTHKLPICPRHYDVVLGNGHLELERLSEAFSDLSARDPHVVSRARNLQSALAQAVHADKDIAGALMRMLDRFEGEPGLLDSWSRLDALIRAQHWRLAHFRVAADDINYRRFFDVSDLACIRMELPELFDHAHSLIFRLMDEGVLDGLRIDHIDGLRDPKAYCLQLRRKAPRPFYLVVEKILARHEDIREDWDIDGATGYEVANLIAGLLMDPSGEAELTRCYAEFTGEREAFDAIVRTSKLRVMENELASELNSLASDVASIARSNPMTADFTQHVLHRALKEIIAVFPVYRTYVDESAAPTEADRRDIDWAVARARRHDAAIDASVFDFLHRLLTCDLVVRSKSGFNRRSVIQTAMRIQQYTGPVMAKGLEDTAFYRYGRMIALNEVGGHPSEFSVSSAAFHRANRRRAQSFPHAMLSTSTHDAKRGEDARARLAALSGRSAQWSQQVAIWNRILRAGSAGSENEPPPDRNDEYFFYQFMLGSWPPELTSENLDTPGVTAFRERLEGAMTKASREAKVHTTWAAPNAVYEEAVLGFIRSALDTTRKNAFLESFLAFQEEIATAAVHNSLVQAVLKMTVPGVPDFYQGAELWDFNFVDPDNRRTVDYERRRKLLRDIRHAPQHSSDNVRNLIANWRDGRIKLRLISELLALRKGKAAVFRDGGYEPLTIVGEAAERIVAFARLNDEETVVVAAALQSADFASNCARIVLPSTDGRPWVDLFSQHSFAPHGDSVAANDVFSSLPVAVLIPA